MEKQKAPTLMDVARVAGVSPFTVSVVLNGSRSNTRVSEATRKRIQDVAATLKYHPNGVARSLARRRTNTLGVFVGIVGSVVALSNEYASGILQGIVTRAAATGYDVLLYTEAWKSADASLGRFRDGRSDGAVVIAPLSDTDVVEALAALHIPLVTISADPAHIPEGVGYVDIDNVAGVQIAVAHLVQLGHRRIAHLTGNLNVPSVPLRREAFVAALAAAGLSCPAGYILTCSYDGDLVPDVLPQLLEHPLPPTAIVAGNDKIAMAVVRTLQALGRSVPEDMSVIGFDDIEAASQVTPSLTTVRQPLSEIGAAAADRLIRQIEGVALPDACPVLIAPELVVRESTAAPA